MEGSVKAESQAIFRLMSGGFIKKLRKRSIMLASLRVKIRTRWLLNRKQEC
jgi:hypothetical protein